MAAAPAVVAPPLMSIAHPVAWFTITYCWKPVTLRLSNCALPHVFEADPTERPARPAVYVESSAVPATTPSIVAVRAGPCNVNAIVCQTFERFHVHGRPRRPLGG